jgi:hypothetical protein
VRAALNQLTQLPELDWGVTTMVKQDMLDGFTKIKIDQSEDQLKAVRLFLADHVTTDLEYQELLKNPGLESRFF